MTSFLLTTHGALIAIALLTVTLFCLSIYAGYELAGIGRFFMRWLRSWLLPSLEPARVFSTGNRYTPKRIRRGRNAKRLTGRRFTHLSKHERNARRARKLQRRSSR
jgi:hypothetical protein